VWLPAVVMATVAVTLLWPGPNRVTRENYDRITDDMTRADVEAILGPPGDYRSDETRLGFSMGWPVGGTLFWHTDEMMILVEFDQSGRMFHRDCIPSPVFVPKGPLDKLLWRSKRQWRRWFPE
jgi:hypothetical protein